MKHRAKITIVLAAALTLSAVLPVTLQEEVHALASDEIQSQIDALESQNQSIQSQIAELEQQHAENNSEIENMVLEKSSLDQQISLLYQQMRVTNDQISNYNLLIADKQDELDEAQARMKVLSEQNRERIRAMEEGGSISYWSVLFKANSFSDFLDRLNMVQEIADSDNRRIREMNEAAEAVEIAQTALEADKQKLETSKLEQEKTEETLLEKRKQSNELLTELVSRGEEYEQLISSSRDRINKLLDEIAQKEVARTEALQAEWEAAHPSTQPPTDTPADPDKPAEETEPGETKPEETEPEETEPEEPESGESDGDYPYCDASWSMPVDYVYVSSPFSDGRMHPILGYVRPHNGIDLAANYGNPVYASRSGYVSVADYEWDGAGNYVFINHGDGFSSVYMHMDHYTVDVGQYVSAGEVIGYVGTSGMSEGPHLHFGIAYNGTYYNPAHYINF